MYRSICYKHHLLESNEMKWKRRRRKKWIEKTNKSTDWLAGWRAVRQSGRQTDIESFRTEEFMFSFYDWANRYEYCWWLPLPSMVDVIMPILYFRTLNKLEKKEEEREKQIECERKKKSIQIKNVWMRFGNGRPKTAALTTNTFRWQHKQSHCGNYAHFAHACNGRSSV